MAITKLMHMKESKKGNKASHLKNSIEYIFKEKKTKGYPAGGNAGKTADEVYQTMMSTKKFWDKLDGRQGYHFVLSFGDEDEITPGLAAAVCDDFTRKFLKDQYDMVYTVHQDTEHIHGHVVFNSINRIDGKKYRYEKGDWKNIIQPITNEICKKYNLTEISVDKEPDRAQKTTEEVKAELDQMIEQSESWESFLAALQKEGYQYREGLSEKYGAYMSIKPPGWIKAIITHRLGEAYTLAALQSRVEGTPIRYVTIRYRKMERYHIRFSSNEKSIHPWSMYQKHFFKKAMQAKRSYRPNSKQPKWQIDRDVKALRNLQNQILLMAKYNLRTSSDVEAYLLFLENENENLSVDLKAAAPAELSKIKAKIQKNTENRRLATDILVSPKIKRKENNITVKKEDRAWENQIR